MFENYDDVVTINEVKEMLKIGKNTAWKLIHSGEIRAFNIGKCVKIPKKSVIDYVTQQTATDMREVKSCLKNVKRTADTNQRKRSGLKQ